MAKSLYESIIYLRDLNETFKKCEFNQEITEAIDDVCTYADDCYVGHCEDVGKIAIKNIEEMKEEWLQKSLEYLQMKWFNVDNTKEIDIEDYRKFMNQD